MLCAAAWAAADPPPAATALAATSAPATQEQAHDARTAAERLDKIMKERIKELHFEGIELDEVIQFLRDVSGVNIVVKWNALAGAGIKRDSLVYLDVKDVEVEKALRLILESLENPDSLDWAEDDGIITISSRDDLATRTTLRNYPAGDLLSATRSDLTKALVPPKRKQGLNHIADVPHPVQAGGENRVPVRDERLAEEADDTVLTAAGLVDLIKSTVNPASWDQGNTSITMADTTLVILQTSRTHKAIARLLESLRQAREAARVHLGVAVVRMKDAAGRRELLQAAAAGKDMSAMLAGGAQEGKWTLDRCRIENSFVGDKIRTSWLGQGQSGYDVLVHLAGRDGQTLEATAVFKSQWQTKSGAVARSDSARLRLAARAAEIVELVPPDAAGGSVVLILWRERTP
ncbi:MAG: hypothetical protein ABFD92_14005 [Planctomycetaceae bacterium]|nr:hypothetical protein [Planctomycetaceae bacterium]